MKVIETRFVGPTNRRGRRIVASDCDGNRAMVMYSGLLNETEAQHAAATALCEKMGWTGPLVGGSTKRGMAFVFLDEAPMRALDGLMRRMTSKRDGNPYGYEEVRAAGDLLARARGKRGWAEWNE
jgi:hypothetical protein